MSKIGELFDDVEQSYFNAELKPISKIYIDLEYMQDLMFGALLYGITVKEEMQYIHRRLKAYNDRMVRGCCRFFPALKKSDQELVELLHKPIVRDRICFLAPWTSVYYQLIDLIVEIKHHNQQITDNKIPITLTISVADIDYPIELQKHLSDTLMKQLGISVNIQQQNRYEGSVKEYLGYDILLLYDYGVFINTFPSAFVGEGKFSDTRIFAQPYIDESLGHKEDNYEVVLLSTEKGMDIYCDFAFLKSMIVLDSKKE